MVKISASLLSIRDNLENTIKELNKLDIDYIHLDIMDGLFVKNTSYTNEEISKIINLTNKPLDVHLMVNDIENYIDKYNLLNTEYITFHYEALKDINKINNIINKIKSYGIKCGISVNPNTDIELIYSLLPKLDMVLIMSVEPGSGGQKFIDNSLNKVDKLKKYIKDNNLNILISIDGGINNINAPLCITHGVNILTIGSSLTSSKNKASFITSIKM